jgi:hypothetical protein
LEERMGIEIPRDNLILKYDGRPFDPTDLAARLREAI